MIFESINATVVFRGYHAAFINAKTLRLLPGADTEMEFSEST